MNPRSLLLDTAARFRAAGIPDPETDSALLLSFLTGQAPLSLRLDSDTELSAEILESFSEMAERRLAREPLQYITGEAPFFGRVFQVDSRVLIPRPETEELCAWALETLPVSDSCRVLDLCCGSGCIGLTLAAERPSSPRPMPPVTACRFPCAAETLRKAFRLLLLIVSYQIRRTFLPRNAAFCSRRFCVSLPLRWTAVPTEWIFTAVFPMNVSGSSGRMESCCSSSDTANRTRCLPCSPQPVLPESR